MALVSAKEMLTKAKADNFDALLHEGKLNILAAIRNIRNMLKVCSDINALCELLSNGEKIKQGKIMPYQIDMAYEIVKSECYSQQVLDALLKGYEASVPNLAEICTGSNLVIMDVSGSMQCCMCDAKTDVEISRICPYDKSKDFTCTNAMIRKHGQSTYR